MLGKFDAVANLAVKDLAIAKKFYGGALGLEQIASEGEEVIVYQTGATTITVYRSEFAGTNEATAVTWDVGDKLETIVQDFKAKGVTFEHYDMPGLTLAGDIHIGEGMKVAWFKDPDGNILNLVGG